jgi:protein TonB
MHPSGLTAVQTSPPVTAKQQDSPADDPDTLKGQSFSPSPTAHTSVNGAKPVLTKLERSSFTLHKGSPSAHLASAGPSQKSAVPASSKDAPPARSIPNLDARGAEQLTPAKLLHRVEPVVPDFAKDAGLQGTVLLSAIIGTDGRLKDVKFVSGDRALAVEAFRAVRDWRYRPYLLNGKPIEAETRIVMNFRP